MGREGRGVRAASETSIEISFTYEGKRCRERIPLKPTPANLKRAEAHRGAVLHAIATGTFDYAATFPNSKRLAPKALHEAAKFQTVEQYLDGWLKQKEQQLKASTFQGYRNIVVNVLTPMFGRLRLDELNRRSLRTWLANYGVQSNEPVSNKRLSNIQSCLRSALHDAMDDDLIESNPLAGWRYTRKEGVSKDSDVDPLAADEQRAILANLPPDMANLIHFAFWTGLRTSEIIALDWADVDFRRDTVTVKRALTRAAKGVPEQPRTKAGIREVKLLTPAREVLKHQKSSTFVGGTGAIFQNPATSERWSDAQIYRAWGAALKRAGVRYRRPYQTRHTYASMMLSAGEHPMWVASQMGHRDWTMIARIYGKWLPEADKHAGERAVLIFTEKSLSIANLKAS